jgi:hypothetical protein
MKAEVSVVRSSDRLILGVGRNFEGVCPTHGAFWDQAIGNHSAIAVSDLKQGGAKQSAFNSRSIRLEVI